MGSADCLADLLQGGLRSRGLNEAFILATFQMKTKAPTHVFKIYNPQDNNEHLDFVVQGKLNKGELRAFNLMTLTAPDWAWQVLHRPTFFACKSTRVPCLCSSYSSIPEEQWQAWPSSPGWHIIGRWAHTPPYGPDDRAAVRLPQDGCLCGLQFGADSWWSAGSLQARSAPWAQQGGNKENAIYFTGEEIMSTVVFLMFSFVIFVLVVVLKRSLV